MADATKPPNVHMTVRSRLCSSNLSLVYTTVYLWAASIETEIDALLLRFYLMGTGRSR